MDESSRLHQNDDPPREAPPSYDSIVMNEVKPSAPPDIQVNPTNTDEGYGSPKRPKAQKYCCAAVLVFAIIGILAAFLFSYFHLKEPVSYENENVGKSIFDCNVENACGHEDNTAAACIKIDTNQPDNRYWSNQGVTEIAFDSWTNIEEADLWCMPCCISDFNKNVEMFLCESLFPKDTVLKRNETFGRCGIDYNL